MRSAAVFTEQLSHPSSTHITVYGNESTEIQGLHRQYYANIHIRATLYCFMKTYFPQRPPLSAHGGAIFE
jgi:hypothetical protein